MKILFVSHDASRTGAPILLLNLVRWLTANKKAQALVLAVDGGELLETFRETGECLLWNVPLERSGVADRIYHKIWGTNNRIRHRQKVLERILRFNPDLIYYSSVGTCRMVPIFAEKIPGAGTVLHVHELETIIRQYNDEECIENAKTWIDHYIAASELVKTNLVNTHRIAPDLIDRIYEYIDTVQWDLKQVNDTKRSGKFIIGSAGNVHWRKGFEFFILLAAELQRRGIQDYECRWSGRVDEEHRAIVEEDLRKLDLGEHVKFPGPSAEMHRFYRQLDVFVITSREDPYPVVALEAALFRLPILCWNRGTGTLEFVERGGGVPVDYLDVRAMADAVLDLKENPEKRDRIGERAYQLALEHDINKAGEKIYEILENITGSGLEANIT